MTKTVTVVIPAYNEAQAVGKVVEDVRKTCADIIYEIIVVDDGSSDETARSAQDAGARVIRHNQNKGYGAALKTGILAAQTEFILTMDADGQHRGEDLRRLWEAADDHDMVVGHRTALMHSQMWRMPGKWLLWVMANYLTGRKIPDLNSGLRLMRKDVVMKYLHVCPRGFSFSTTITMALVSRGYNVAYIPIQVSKRVGKSTINFSTGMNTVLLILRIASLFNPLRIFIPLSLVFGIAGLGLGVYYYFIESASITGAPVLLLVTAVIFFTLGLISDQVSQLRLERFE